MWKDQKQMLPNRTTSSDQQEDQANNNTDSQEIGIPPTDWIFDGWFAFRLYGPLVDESMLEYKTDAFADPPDILPEDDDDEDVKIKGENGLLSAHPSTGGMTTTSGTSTTASSSRKRSARPLLGPFSPHMSDDEKRHAMDIVLQRIATREQLAHSEIATLQQRAESVSKSMEMELKIALSVASEDPNHESWREYRTMQRQLTQIWTDIEQKHKENKTRDVQDSELVNEYLSAVTVKKFRFDPKPS